MQDTENNGVRPALPLQIDMFLRPVKCGNWVTGF
jgi:hypothetical protein